VAAAALLVGGAVALASGGGAPSTPTPLAMADALLPIQTLAPNSKPLVVTAPLGATITSATLVGSAGVVGATINTLSSGTLLAPPFVTITPNGQSPSFCIFNVEYTDAAGTKNVCTIAVAIGSVPNPSPLTLVDGVLPLQNLSRHGAPMTLAVPAGATVTGIDATVDAVTWASHVPVSLTANDTSVVIAPNGNGPTPALVKITWLTQLVTLHTCWCVVQVS